MNYIEGPLSTPPDPDNEPGSSAKGKRTKSKSFGSALLGKEVKDSTDAPKSKTSELFNTKDKSESADGRPLLNSLKEADPVPLEQAPDDDLSREEEKLLSGVIREEARRQRQEEPVETPLDTLTHEVLDEFDTKIIEEKIDPDLAFTQVLESRGWEADESSTLNLPEEAEIHLRQSSPPDTHEFSFDSGSTPDTKESSSTDPTESETPATTVAGSAPSGGGGGTRPPTQTRAGGGGYNPPFRPNGPNFYPTPATYSTPPRTEYIYRRSNFWDGAIIGGIIGYLIGRRRGRIKTERKLKPVRQKLEKRVKTLEAQLSSKDYKIRELARQKMNQPEVTRQDPNALTVPKIVKGETTSPKKVSSIELTGRLVIERQKAPEAQLLHVEKKAPERIGQLIVSGEAAPKHQPAPEKAKPPVLEKITERRVETMNRAELLRVSEKILVEDSSLRRIYETHLIGERGLRRLVNEYFKGGDLKKALRREILEREIDFERDPVLRDLPSVAASSSIISDSSTALSHMINQAAAKVAPTSEEAAFFKAKADYEVSERRKDRQKKRMMDVALASTITAVLAIIIILFLAHA